MKDEDYNMDENGASEEFFSELLMRFESMIEKGESFFFDSDDLMDIIDYYILSGNPENAKIAIENGLTQYPDNILFTVYQARYLFMIQETAKAIKILKQIEKVNPNEADVLLALGEFSSYSKKHSEAASYLERALKLVEEDDKLAIIEHLIDEYETIGQHKKMIPHLKKLIEVQTTNFEAMNQLSFCYSILNKEDEGLKYFNSIIEENPFNIVAWFNLGNLFSSLELYEKAIDSYEYVLAIEPEYITAGVKMASALMLIERIDEAIEVLEAMLKFDPSEASVYYNLGACYADKKNYKKAEKFYVEALKFEPDLTEASLGLAYAYVGLNKHKNALKEIKKVLEVIDEMPELWFLRAYIETNLDLFEESLLSINKGLEIKPDDFTARLTLAGIYTDYREDYETAIEVLEEGLRLDPKCVDLIYRLSAILFEAGKNNEAIKKLHDALSLDKEKLYLLYDYNPSLEFYEDVEETIKHYF